MRKHSVPELTKMAPTSTAPDWRSASTLESRIRSRCSTESGCSHRSQSSFQSSASSTTPFEAAVHRTVRRDGERSTVTFSYSPTSSSTATKSTTATTCPASFARSSTDSGKPAAGHNHPTTVRTGRGRAADVDEQPRMGSHASRYLRRIACFALVDRVIVQRVALFAICLLPSSRLWPDETGEVDCPPATGCHGTCPDRKRSRLRRQHRKCRLLQ